LKEKLMVIANQTDALRIIRDSVNEFLPECSILLFGSRARRDYSEDSDFDLMIVTETAHETKELRLLKAMIRRKLARNRIPADIIIQSKSEIEINRKIAGHIVRQVLKEGIPI
jgi:predicted nucleotidyltransferase